ncbi:glycosyltransferase [Pacificimonas flava]|uniref:glycosyltransferase n=1 Tax=Pacificimonas flava TaxID=1234595 RepID=UPI00098EF575|nr:glycosyltransferase [Pacificimonas flava]MBB5281852.1 glycosyltransferase involved in cell wall biosynthesis [Pacificimonas flava]
MTLKRESRIAGIVPRSYFPYLTGGLEFTANILAEELSSQGYGYFVLAKREQRGLASLVTRVAAKVRGPYASKKKLNGYQAVYDQWHPSRADRFIADANCDAVVCHLSFNEEGVEVATRAQKPTMFYLHSKRVEPNLRDAVRQLDRVKLAGVSEFSCKALEDATGRAATLLTPWLNPRKYFVHSTGQSILVVNPDLKKGGDIVCEVAALMPERQFVVAGGWQLQAQTSENRIIEERLAQLENVTRLGVVGDMRGLFENAAVLFFPCRQPEAFGRIVAEAHICGIPTVGTGVGALGTTIGSGGKVLPLQSSSKDWADALEIVGFRERTLYQEAAFKMADTNTRGYAYYLRTVDEIFQDLVGEHQM